MDGTEPRCGPSEVAELLAAVWGEHFGGWESFLDRKHAIAASDAHVEDVRRTCPEGRLIEWRVSDGWQPICVTLDIPIPGLSAPHLNARDSAWPCLARHVARRVHPGAGCFHARRFLDPKSAGLAGLLALALWVMMGRASLSYAVVTSIESGTRVYAGSSAA